jgi:hypothetical protein
MVHEDPREQLQQFNHQLSQSTVSESLSDRFSTLDGIDNKVEGSRIRLGQWPDLENLLVLWQKRIEEQGGFTSGDLIREKARQVWCQLPQYSGQECPDFSISEHIFHGEAGLVPESAEEQMKSLQTLAGEFQEEYIYNMDETGLFWRMTPSRGLATTSHASLKKDKSRISLVSALMLQVVVERSTTHSTFGSPVCLPKILVC